MAEEAKTKRTVNRSAAYPAISLEEAVEATKLLRDNLGAGPYSRESAAQALGYASVSGASSGKIAACVHFGLLNRDGNVYRQSDLAQKLFVFFSEEEKQATLRIAVGKPALYAKLIATYSGSALPNMLSSILIRNFNITERVAKVAAADFIKSAEYAGILKNGVISLEGSGEPEAPNAPSADAPTTIEGNTPAPAAQTAPTQQQAPYMSQTPAAPQGYLPVEIPGTDIKVLFPLQYAFNLSTGAFKMGIEELAKNAKATGINASNDEPATATQE